MSALKAIHAGCRQLGLDEETRREVYARVTGKSSASEMSEGERQRVVEELRRLGFARKEGRRADGRAKLTGRYAPKLQALWIGAWNLGLVENRDDAALLAFVKRQTGIDHTRFLTHADDANRAIEALKKWMERGGVDWSVGRWSPCWSSCAGERIARAQYRKVANEFHGGAADWPRFRQFVEEISGSPAHWMTAERDWIPVMNALGPIVRGAAERKTEGAAS